MGVIDADWAAFDLTFVVRKATIYCASSKDWL
jgi:hypothetical protein